MEIIYVAEGSVSVKVGISDYVLHAGEFTIINPFELHALYATDEDNKIFILEISTDFYDPCFEGTIFVSAYYLYEKAAGKDFEKIRDTLRKLFDLHLSAAARQLSGRQQDPDSAVVSSEQSFIMQSGTSPVFPVASAECSAEYEKILLRSLINYFELHFTSEYFLLSDHKENTLRDNAIQANRLKSILTYFYEHFPQKIQLQDVADVTFVNRYHISHLIKSGIGLTFSELLQHIRIEKAEIYLLGTELPISQIVYELGFSSYRYFNQHFKSLFHMTPAAYRKKYSHDTIRYKDITYRKPVSAADIDAAIRKLAVSDCSFEVQTISLADIMTELGTADAETASPRHEENRHELPKLSALYDTPLLPALLLGYMAEQQCSPADFAKENPQFFAPDEPAAIESIDMTPAESADSHLRSNPDLSSTFSGTPGNMTASGIRKSSFYMKELLEPFMNAHATAFPCGFAVKSGGSTELLFYNAPADLGGLDKVIGEIDKIDKSDDASGNASEFEEYLRRCDSMPDAEWTIDLSNIYPDSTAGSDMTAETREIVTIRRDLKLELDAFCQMMRAGMLHYQRSAADAERRDIPPETAADTAEPARMINEDIIQMLNSASAPDARFKTVRIPSQESEPEAHCTVTLPPFGVCRITLAGL